MLEIRDKEETWMNVILVLAGAVALLTTAGHFTAGAKMYLKPLLKSDIEPVAKKVLHCVFHYVSTFLILSSLALLMLGFMNVSGAAGRLLAVFIGLNYTLFAVWQLVLIKQSGIERGPLKMFQWIFFVIIAALAFLGGALWDVF